MKIIITGLSLFCLLTGCQHIDNNQDTWINKIRNDHPRLFITREAIPKMRARAQGVCNVDFEKLKNEVDALPDKAELIFLNDKFTLQPDGSVKFKSGAMGKDIVLYTGAQEAIKATLVYLITNDKTYQIKAKNYLTLAVDFFSWCLEHKIKSSWNFYYKLNALVAYDWLYNSLSCKERRDIIVPLLKYIKALQPGGAAKFHRCIGGYNSGNYGVLNLTWYAGLAAYNDGFDNKLARKFLTRGYALNLKMMNYRDKLSAGSGLLSAATMGYTFGAYPYASFAFLHTWQSATGEDISSRWNQMRYYPNWFDWSIIPGNDHLLSYGIGDTAHHNNRLWTGIMYTHMAQSIHFYGKKFPQSANTARVLISLLPDRDKRFHSFFPFLPFILFEFDPTEKARSTMTVSAKKAEVFDSFGLVVMRSGTGIDDTYCLFRAGSKYGNHQHYDENHFTIYKKDFLALDSGSRTKTMHHCYYAPQSVAHNTVLIHDQKEKMPPFWKPWGPIAEKDDGKVYYNHGGQFQKSGAKRLAFYSNKFYTYVANDATAVYHPDKCAEAVRQFVFVHPDYFIAYDRVESIKPEQRKEWLLHIQNEPVKIDNNYFRTDNGGGRLFFKTLLPENAIQRKIGGSGRQFRASGKNWPLPKGEAAFAKKNHYGQWRIEVLTERPQKSARFLHFLQAAIAKNTPGMIPVKRMYDESCDGVEFTDKSGRKWEVLFNRDHNVGGSIKGWDKNSTLIVSESF